MSDYGHLAGHRSPRMEPGSGAMLMRDGGYEAARMLRGLAVISIGARIFLTYASANRISVVHRLLSEVPADTLVVNGSFDLNGLPDATDLISSAHDADGLVTFAWVVTIGALVLFLLASIGVHRRRKRDTLAAAIDGNRAIRFASRLYLVPTIGSGVAQNVLRSSSDMTPWDRLHHSTDIDATNIVLQLFVIAFLLIVALATGRELRAASTIPAASST